MNGIINFYFPCKLKNLPSLRLLNRRWKATRNMQTKEIDLLDQPLTDLIYKEEYRNENEYILSDFQKSLGETKHCNSNPFATPCLRNIYRGMANDYIFSKNASVILSTFTIEYTASSSKSRTEEKEIKHNFPGLLLLNVNAENRVGTFIMSVSFKKLDVDQCIYLKHIFFKNCEVTITEKEYKKTSILDKDDCGLCVLKNEKSISNGIYKSTTIRDYIKNKSPFSNRELDEKIDFRCRYTYLEIDKLLENSIDCKEIEEKYIYGLITSDEYYNEFNNDVIDKDKSHFDTIIRYKHPISLYKIYVKGYHALQINNSPLCKNKFTYPKNDKHINMDDFVRIKSCIAGISVTRAFPKYLKAVEIHYLINNETTNEISPKERSYINPFVFIRRAIRLWKVIYEIDTNKYHNSSEFIESFGINKLLKDLRDEYNNLLVHIVGFFTIVLTLLTLCLSILQIVVP